MGVLFISHSSRNNDAAVKVRDWLNEQGWREIFLDLDPSQGLAPGQRWQDELKKAGERCLAVVVLVSPEWVDSRWCQTEYLVADQLGKKMFPVLIAPTPFETIPLELKSRYQLADISTSEREAEGFARLAVGLKRAGLDPKSFTWPPTGEPNRPIYRGLQSLDEQDAAIFFGRDTAITKGLDALRRMRAGAPERMLVILGASGSGKSSFLKAGLIARLKRDEENFVVLPTIRPERAALTGMQGVLACFGRDVKTAQDARTAFARRRAEILERFKRFADAGGETYAAKPPTIVIPIDQCEEFFTADNTEAARALDLLAESVQLDGDALVVATIRSDSFERLQTEQHLAVVPRLPLDLPPLPPSGFKDVIEGPARLAQPPLAIEPALTEQLLKDLDAADALPLLAFTLQRLVATQGTDGKLSLADYVDGLHGLQGAIAGAVDVAFSAAVADPSLPRERPALERLAREAFIPALVQLDDAAAHPKRRVERFDALPEAVRPLVRHFVHQRLLVMDRRVVQDVEKDIVEVAHEAILRQWQLLGSWIAEERDALRTLDSLRRAAAEWHNTESGLVHRGDRLAEAERLALRPDFGAALTPNERAYLHACRDSENARRAAEAERTEKEKRSLERQRRFQRRALLATVAAFVVTAAGGWAVVSGQRYLARSQSLMLSRVADQFYAQNDFVRGMRVAILAAKDTFLSPAAPEAADSLASNAAGSLLEWELRGHQGSISGLVFSSNGSRVLTWSADGTARLWDAATGASVGGPLQHDGPVLGAVFSTSETRILTWSEDGMARLWNADTGTPIGRPLEPDNAINGTTSVNGATFSEDESRILTWGNDRTVRLWNAGTGEPIGQPLMHDDWITGAVFSKDEKRITTWSVNRKAWLWDVAAGAQIGSTFTHDGRVNSGPVFSKDQSRMLTWDGQTAWLRDAATGEQIGEPFRYNGGVSGAVFSGDESRILAWSGNGTAWLWDTATRRQLGDPLRHDYAVYGAVFSQDESRILTWSDDGTVRLWTGDDGAPIGSFRQDGSVTGAVFSKDESRILTRSDDGTARLWNAATGEEIGRPLKHDGAVNGAVFSKDERHILTWSAADGTVRRWNAATDGETGPPLKHDYDKQVTSAAFSKDETRIITSSYDGTARLWNTSNGTPIYPPLEHAGYVFGAVFSPDESRILTWSNDGTARLWNAADGAPIGQLKHDEAAVNGAVFSRDESRVLTWARDGMVGLWNAYTAEPIGRLKHSIAVNGAVFSRDEKRVLTWSGDTARLWDANTRAQIGDVLKHGSTVGGAAFSNNESRILTWSVDKTARLWDAANGTPVDQPLQHEFPVGGALFSKDDSRILTWSQNTAQLWSASNGKQIGQSLRHVDAVYGAVFSRDESRILTWSRDGTARVWNADTGTQIGLPLIHNNWVNGAVFSRDESRILTWSRDRTARLWNVATGKQIGPPLTHDNWVNGAVFSKDESRVLSWGEDGTARQFDVRWTVRRESNASLVSDVCAAKLPGVLRNIDASDTQAAPILRGREGEDVCASRTFFDRLIGLFSFAK